MIEFEWYIRRAKIDLNLFFKVENINSDEDLVEYCKLKNLTIPKGKYFSQKVEVFEPEVTKVLEKPIPKPKNTKTPKLPTKKTELEVVEETAVKEEKPARKTRRRTTRKKTTK